MPDYTSNFAALLTGHLGLPEDPPTGGVSPTSDKYNPQGRTDLTTNVDIRDALAHAISGGYTSFSDDDIKANYKYIAGQIGAPKAQKLFVQAFQFNQRPGSQGKSNEQKIQSFYELGSADPDTKDTLERIKNSSSGPVEGYRSSVNEGVRLMSGKDKKAANVTTPDAANQIQSTVTAKTTT